MTNKNKANYLPCKMCQKPVFNATGICTPCRLILKDQDKARRKKMGLKNEQSREIWKYLK